MDKCIYLTIETFRIIISEYFDLLFRRYERFAEIRAKNGLCLDLETYLDIILVQLRALLCDDNSLMSYTINNWLRIIEDDEAKQKIDELLNVPVPGWNFVRSVEDDTIINKDTNIYGAIKIITNRTICHYDNLELNRETKNYREEVNNRTYTEGYISHLKSKMCDLECEYSIDVIVERLSQILQIC